MALFYVEYQNGKVNCAAIISDKKLNKLKKTPSVSIKFETELKSGSEKSFYSGKIRHRIEKYNLNDFSNDNSFGEYGSDYYGYCDVDDLVKEGIEVPMTVAGVGNSSPTKWLYSSYGNFLNVYGIHNRISITFNVSSVCDIENKIKYLENMRDAGYCTQDEVSELKERVSVLSNLSVGGKRPQAFGVCESSGKGKVDTVYRDGKAVKIKRRGRFKISTEAQRNAAENARKYAHTDEANKKRRKSISARGDGKILGEL